MNATIMEVTLRQLLGRRRTILMALAALIPTVVALAYRASDSDTVPAEFASGMLNGLVVTSLLPLVALVFATAALGSEIEDGTAVYLLAKPISRAEIVISKLVVAALVTVALVVPATIAGGAVAMGGLDDTRIALGFGLAVAAGAVVYSALFLLFSLLTSRALIAGLIYVFLWEGVLAGLFRGLRLLSVRQYTLGIADALSNVSDTILDARLEGGTAIIAALAVGLAATVLATQRLKRFEIGETV